MNLIVTRVLEKIFKKDQESIRKFRKGELSSDGLIEIQRRDFETVKEIIEREGFPYINTASQDAYNGAFLSILHSDSIEYMEYVIKLFKNAEENQIIKKHLAFLIDKRAVMIGEPQIYGTQYDQSNGGNKLFPSVDQKNLNARRKEMGLEEI